MSTFVERLRWLVTGNSVSTRSKRSGYDVAKKTRLTDKLYRQTTNQNALQILMQDGGNLRQVGRYLARNTPQGKRALRKIAARVIGPSGITPVFDDESLNIAFEEWRDMAGLRGETYRELQRIALMDFISAGDGYGYWGVIDGAFHINLFEPEDLVSYHNQATKELIDGIEYDRFGRAVRYWINDPGSFTYGYNANPISIPAKRVAHLFYKERPSQIRGASEFAAGAMGLFDSGDAKFLELTGLRAQASVALHVQPDAMNGIGGDLSNMNSVDGDETAGSDAADGGTDYEIEFAAGEVISTPAKIHRLESNTPSRGFLDLMKVLTREWAVSVGVPPHVISGDYSDATYSSMRQSDNNARDAYEDFQETFITRFARPIVKAWLIHKAIRGEVGIKPGAVNQAIATADWMRPGFDYIDPLKDVQADERRINIGGLTFDQYCGEQGKDGRAQRRALLRAQRLDEEMGVITPGVGWQEFVQPVPMIEDSTDKPKAKIQEVG